MASHACLCGVEMPIYWWLAYSCCPLQVLRALRRARKHKVESLPPSAFLLAAAEQGVLCIKEGQCTL